MWIKYVFPQFGSLPFGETLERVKKSPNYRDGQFCNLIDTPVMVSEDGFFKNFYEFALKKKPNRRPERPMELTKTDFHSIFPQKDLIVWLGHSSYYLQLSGIKILVDPALSGHASPFPGMIKAFDGSNIFHPDDFPDLDYLLITHDHWDHLDYKAILRLAPRVQSFLCGLGVGSHLEHWGISTEKIHQLDWWDNLQIKENWRITAVPSRHFSGRGLKRNQALWVSYVLETPKQKLFLSGDGGYGPHMKAIGDKFGPFDMAIMEHGQYNEKWKYIHMLPHQLFGALNELQAKAVLPTHHSKFALADHAWTEPMDQVRANAEGTDIRLIVPQIGEITYL